MTVSELHRPHVAEPARPPLLPERPRRMGPITRLLVLRTVAVVLVVQAIGIALVVSGGVRARAAGLSLALPGGGFLYTAAPVAFVLTWVAISLALVLWWGMSLHWGVPLVWFASSGASALWAQGPRLGIERGTTWWWAMPVVHVLTVAALGTLVYTFEARFRRKRANVAELNEYLGTATLPEPARPLRIPDDMDAELLRWAYELTMQPVDEFRGFEWGEQFHGGTVVRYQLNYLGWALAPYAVNYVPNAPRQIELALRNLVLKQTDLRVWRYWRTLNLIGNLDANPDPLVRDNIMFSGFTGDQINLYEAATGSTLFDEPGSLTFVWEDGRTFAYDHHSWMEAVQRNFERSRLTFFPCEPGWAFAACNTIGAQALLGHDRLHGTTMWSDLEPRWRTALEEEYLLPDGNYANIRSTHTGLSWDTGETPGGEYFTTGSHGFADVAPDLALRGRMLQLRGAPEKMAGMATMMRDGELMLELPEEWERNRVRRTAVNAWTKLVAGARMVGQGNLAEAALRAGDRQCATGEVWPERPLRTGVANLALHMLVRWSTPMDNATLNLRGWVPPVGPVLDEVPWPQVLVTVARSSDGETLDLVLRPGPAPSEAPVTLGFIDLRPITAYCLLDGDRVVAELVASAEGTAGVAIPVLDAIALRLVPAEGDVS
jgi:Linalool dehydratase/isomerase